MDQHSLNNLNKRNTATNTHSGYIIWIITYTILLNPWDSYCNDGANEMLKYVQVWSDMEFYHTFQWVLAFPVGIFT